MSVPSNAGLAPQLAGLFAMLMLAATSSAADPPVPAVPVQANKVTQFGITWTFAREYPVGQFVNGDWWVVGPVDIVAIDPPSAKRADGRIVNGSMVNPIVSGDTGFDSRAPQGKYKDELNVALGVTPEKPLRLPGGSSLLSSISVDADPGTRPVQSVALLTVVEAVPPADAFRPAYAKGDKIPRHRFSQVDTTKLKSLKVVGMPPSWESVEASVARPFIDFAPNWNRSHASPRENGSTYGRDTSRTVSRVTVMLLSDYPLEQKRKTLISFIQRGIDLYGLFADWEANQGSRAFPWRSDGGHSSGRKWPIIFAGAMLGNEKMLGVAAASKGLFHEDAQTVYITREHVELTNSDKWRPAYGGQRGKQPYDAKMIGMPEWVGSAKPETANAHWTGHPYRLGGNQHAFQGMALGVLAMGLKTQWNHDVWFDYQTRYCAIMSNQPDPFAKLLGYEPVQGSTPEQPFPGWQLYWDRWPYDMWLAHWDEFYQLPKVPAAPVTQPQTP